MRSGSDCVLMGALNAKWPVDMSRTYGMACGKDRATFLAWVHVPSTTMMLNPECTTRIEKIVKAARNGNELLALTCGAAELVVMTSAAFVDSEEHGVQGAVCMSSWMVMEREEGKKRKVFGSEQLQSEGHQNVKITPKCGRRALLCLKQQRECPA
jgi:hypothetical protein